MFSQLGPLFKTTFRQAESNDTRQAIPHEERDKGQKKQDDHKPKEAPSDFWEDNTSVSVNALRTFLIDFLKTMPENSKGDADIAADLTETPETAAPIHREPKDTRNARAMKAYTSTAQQNTAAARPSRRTQTPVEHDRRRVVPTADLLQSKEIRDIHGLIADLDTLSRRGITDLAILRAENFVESLKNAVIKAKSELNL